MKYRTYRFGGRDVLTVPSSPTVLRRVGVAAFPAATSRTRVFRSVLRGLVSLGLDGVVGIDSEDLFTGSGRGDGRAFVAAMGQALGRDDLRPVVVYPRQRDRRRVYLHLVAADGERIAFAKVSEDQEGDGQLANEGHALRALTRAGARWFRFPSLLGDGTFDGRRYILLAPLPLHSQALPPRWTPRIEMIRTEIAGDVRQEPRLDTASWWPRFERRAEEAAGLAEALIPVRGEPFRAATAHGDFVNWNIHDDGTDVWLFDWEGHTVDAPELADEVRFFLGIHTRALAANPAWGARLLQQYFRCEEPERLVRVSRALALLCANGVAGALAVGAIWNRAPLP